MSDLGSTDLEEDSAAAAPYLFFSPLNDFAGEPLLLPDAEFDFREARCIVVVYVDICN